MLQTKIPVIAFSALLCSQTLNAQSYSSAKLGIQSGQDIALYPGVKTDILYPYLAYDFYREHLERDDEIQALIDKHFSAPPIRKLHNLWIVNNYQRGQYQQVVKYYFDTNSTAANCAYRSALYALGKTQQALDKIDQLWLSPNSISEYCEPVFAAWGNATNPDYILKRAMLAYDAGNINFAKRMASKLNNEQGATISQYVNFVKSPLPMLSYSLSELTATKLHQYLLPLALEKLVRKDSVGNADFAMQFSTVIGDYAGYQQMLEKLVSYLSNRGSAKVIQAYALLIKPSKNADESLIRYLVRSEDWNAIVHTTDNSSETLSLLYWRARALEKLGQKKPAQKLYEKLSQTRSYYGFLAADRVGKAYQFNEEKIVVDKKLQHNLSKNTSLQRAKALFQIGERIAARREIFQVSRLMDKTMIRQLAYWLNQQGYHNEVIYTLGKARDWNDISIRFPTPYTDAVSKASAMTGVDPTWIYAIIRQESSMNPRAVSRAKAKGLMQLIPSTSRKVANDMGIAMSSGEIFNPNTNIKLGAGYLQQMYTRFANLALASAAYNAGPHRVGQWTENGIGDIEIWVEKIPFNETRKYVKRILEYQQVYARHLKKPIGRVTEIMQGL